jgi:hypothetical protein
MSTLRSRSRSAAAAAVGAVAVGVAASGSAAAAPTNRAVFVQTDNTAGNQIVVDAAACGRARR